MTTQAELDHARRPLFDDPESPVKAPPRKARERGRSRVITHILLYWRESDLRWHVAAGDERGEIRGEAERYVTRREAERAAGRMAKRTGAQALLISDGKNIRKIDYAVLTRGGQ